MDPFKRGRTAVGDAGEDTQVLFPALRVIEENIFFNYAGNF